MEKIEVVSNPCIEQLLEQQLILLEMQMELIKAVLHPPLIVTQEE